MRGIPEKFLVSFSFAGEQRDLVRSVAEAVEKRLGSNTVFYDDWFEYYIAGDDADLRLQDIYGQRSDLVVLCVSKSYGGKPWTRAEYKAIRALQMRLYGSVNEQDAFRILFLRVGDGDVEGISDNAICPDARAKSVEQTVELIVSRLRLIVPEAGRPVDTTSEEGLAHRVYLAECTPDTDEWRDRLKTHLEDMGWSVLPGAEYPQDQYETLLTEDLKRSRAFIQVIGQYPWRRGGYDRVQNDAAEKLAIARFRYRHPETDLTKAEPAHREFLSATDIIATGFDDFKKHLEKELKVLLHRPDEVPSAETPPRVLVGIRAENPDALWEKVFEWIYEQERIDSHQLRPGDSFAVTYEAEPCQGFLVVCDATALANDDRSPREYLEQCRQIQLKEKNRNRRPPVGLVYWPPPAIQNWARLLRSTPLSLHRILGDAPANLGDFFAEVRRVER